MYQSQKIPKTLCSQDTDLWRRHLLKTSEVSNTRTQGMFGAAILSLGCWSFPYWFVELLILVANTFTYNLSLFFTCIFKKQLHVVQSIHPVWSSGLYVTLKRSISFWDYRKENSLIIFSRTFVVWLSCVYIFNLSGIYFGIRSEVGVQLIFSSGPNNSPQSFIECNALN